MFRFARFLQNLDRRIVYFVLLAAMSLPFIWHYSLPIYPDTTTKQFYNTIEEIAKDEDAQDKVVMVLHNWGPGTSGENKPQFDVIMRHLIRANLDFVFVCTIADPVFHDTAMLTFEESVQIEARKAKDRGEEPRELVYGEDYLNFGYINAPTFATFAEGVVTSPRELYGTDYRFKRSLREDSFPLLERFREVDDIAAVLIVSAGDESKDISGLVKSKHPELKIGAATMGIVANDLYPYVKSGQLFGMINSQRGASEYRTLLDGDTTTPLDNAMSAGKTTLLGLLLVGNAAFLLVRWGQRRGRLQTSREVREPLPPLPAWFMWGLFAVVTLFVGGMAVYEYARYQDDGKIARERPVTDEDQFGYTYYGTATPETFATELEQEEAAAAENPLWAQYQPERANRLYRLAVERRIGDFIALICVLGVFAFTLGDNRFYRFIEAVIVGGSMAYLLDQLRQIVYQDWLVQIGHAWSSLTQQLQPGDPGFESAWNLLWILLIIPGSLWYFTYSKKYRWLNQWIVALFLGFALGPEFENRIGQVLPQILDTVQPLWPWTPYEGGVVDPSARIEHLAFVIVLVFSLTYFVFFFRPKTAAGNSVLTTGRLIMMVGFGAMFGNTVNTRLSWLSLPITHIWEATLGKIAGVLPIW
jgi:uncharacterized membrane protein YidH (DUF202 family)